MDAERLKLVDQCIEKLWRDACISLTEPALQALLADDPQLPPPLPATTADQSIVTRSTVKQLAESAVAFLKRFKRFGPESAEPERCPSPGHRGQPPKAVVVEEKIRSMRWLRARFFAP